MSIQPEVLRRMAHLSRLEISESEFPRLLEDFSSMVRFIEQLREVDTTGVEPLMRMTQEVNALRQDIAENELTPEQALLNAPRGDGSYFRVPKVIE